MGGRRPVLGEVEHLVLLAVLRLGETGYAVSIRDEIAACAGVTLSRGTVYVTLDRLERQGHVRSWFADPTPERGGKAKRLFRMERGGLAALRANTRAVGRMLEGTPLAYWRGGR